MEQPTKQDRFKVYDDTIVDTYNHAVVMRLSLPYREATLTFTCKVLNGELVPKWDDGVLIWVRI
jgi:hypothetical protein